MAFFDHVEHQKVFSLLWVYQQQERKRESEREREPKASCYQGYWVGVNRRALFAVSYVLTALAGSDRAKAFLALHVNDVSMFP